MAGHSKWSNIKHRKAGQDAKRAKIFTKIIRELTVAARDGGGNIDDNPGIASQFGISSIPTLLIFKGGEITESFVGVRPKAALQEALDSASN